jgi:hypothetical protein
VQRSTVEYGCDDSDQALGTHRGTHFAFSMWECPGFQCTSARYAKCGAVSYPTQFQSVDGAVPVSIACGFTVADAHRHAVRFANRLD